MQQEMGRNQLQETTGTSPNDADIEHGGCGKKGSILQHELKCNSTKLHRKGAETTTA